MPSTRFACVRYGNVVASRSGSWSVPGVLASLSGRGWLAKGAVCVVELAEDEPFVPPAGFEPVDERTYSKTKFVFLSHGA